MKKHKHFTVSLLLAGLMLTVAPLLAQEQNAPQPQMPQMPMMEPMMEPMMPQLTDAQREQLQSLRIKHLKEIMPLETELRIKELELQALWDADKLDSKAIIAKVKELSELRNKLELTRTNHRLEIAQLLTPEQRRQMRHMFGMGMGPGMGMGRRMMRRHRCMEQKQFGPQEPNCCPQK
ncbi:MAG: Spy/CpxP family protein refolding chaperone [candidate division WOR-3 bacterium]|nr:Spy/CpxP family protein refolding chaperone [candidate division WOR-3 bacterium]